MSAYTDSLKSQGWTDADIAAIAGVLPKLEQQFNAVTTERDRYKGLNDEWQRKLDEEYNPRLTIAERELQQARLDAAKANELVRIAKDFGYVPVEEPKPGATPPTPGTPPPGSPMYDPKAHPTWQDAAKMLDGEAQAIAQASDLAQEYAYLTGKQLFDYETVIDGRQMRGLQALRLEAKANKSDLYGFVAQKFNFQGKRDEKAVERQKAHDDSIAAAAVEKARNEWAQQHGANPMTMSYRPSTRPFIPATTNAEGKQQQPWERGSQTDRRSARLQNLVAMEMKQSA
jgi:hypothetical protein